MRRRLRGPGAERESRQAGRGQRSILLSWGRHRRVALWLSQPHRSNGTLIPRVEMDEKLPSTHPSRKERWVGGDNDKKWFGTSLPEAAGCVTTLRPLCRAVPTSRQTRRRKRCRLRASETNSSENTQSKQTVQSTQRVRKQSSQHRE